MTHAAENGHRTTPWFGLAIAAVLVIVALVAPALLKADPLRQDLMAASLPPSAEWWLGTDPLGRSVLARTVAAARVSLGAAIVSSAITAAIGTAIGLLAAELRGLPERVLLAVADTVYACPGLLLVLLVTELFDGGITIVLAGLIVTRWPAFARLSDSLARDALARPAVEASRLLGFGCVFRLRRHVWPAVRPSIVSITALQFGNTLLSVASLGFLGVGLLPPQPEWGAMIAEALPYFGDQPMMLLAPATGLFLATWCATLVGEAYAGVAR